MLYDKKFDQNLLDVVKSCENMLSIASSSAEVLEIAHVVLTEVNCCISAYVMRLTGLNSDRG